MSAHLAEMLFTSDTLLLFVMISVKYFSTQNVEYIFHHSVSVENISKSSTKSAQNMHNHEAIHFRFTPDSSVLKKYSKWNEFEGKKKLSKRIISLELV